MFLTKRKGRIERSYFYCTHIKEFSQRFPGDFAESCLCRFAVSFMSKISVLLVCKVYSCVRFLFNGSARFLSNSCTRFLSNLSERFISNSCARFLSDLSARFLSDSCARFHMQYFHLIHVLDFCLIHVYYFYLIRVQDFCLAPVQNSCLT